MYYNEGNNKRNYRIERKNPMKKRLFILTLGVFFLTACANTTKDTSSEIAEGNILYTGTVAELNEESILMEGLEPVDADVAAIEEVVLLTPPLAELEVGDTLEVILVENAPMTRSLPPQIPGNSIVEVRIPSK